MNRFAILICAFAFVIEPSRGQDHVSPHEKTLAQGELIIETTNGLVEGLLERSCRDNKEFAAFRGIPYAEPPVGKLRFKDPVEKANWIGVYNATYQRYGCIQIGKYNPDLYSEDCLFLNVYTPNIEYLQNKLSPLKAVMVFIHGGAFVEGSSYEQLYSPDFLIEEDVVLVTMNYRLGPFGFLSLQNADVPGNAGLKDQNMALKWVQKNILNFGGDPKRVTIFGESAGSASVNYHLLSKSSAGLFSGAIMESGTVLSPWAWSAPDLALDKAYKLARNTFCWHLTRTKILECLQKVSAKLLAEKESSSLTAEEIFSLRLVALQPTTEPDVPGAFFTSKPFEALNEGNFTKVPVIIGSNSKEGLLLYPAFKENQLINVLLPFLGMDLSRFAPYQLDIKPFTLSAIQLHYAISGFYFNNRILDKNMLFQVLDLLGDVNFILPIQLAAGIMAEHSSEAIYNYRFTYDGGYAAFKIPNNFTDVAGVAHADELGYLFYIPPIHCKCGNKSFHEDYADELTINRFTTMWANFAKRRNPNDLTVLPEWKPFGKEQRNYLEIGSQIIPSEGLKLETMLFWEKWIHKILSRRSLSEQPLGDFKMSLFG